MHFVILPITVGKNNNNNNKTRTKPGCKSAPKIHQMPDRLFAPAVSVGLTNLVASLES